MENACPDESRGTSTGKMKVKISKYVCFCGSSSWNVHFEKQMPEKFITLMTATCEKCGKDAKIDFLEKELLNVKRW